MTQRGSPRATLLGRTGHPGRASSAGRTNRAAWHAVVACNLIERDGNGRPFVNTIASLQLLLSNTCSQPRFCERKLATGGTMLERPTTLKSSYRKNSIVERIRGSGRLSRECPGVPPLGNWYSKRSSVGQKSMSFFGQLAVKLGDCARPAGLIVRGHRSSSISPLMSLPFSLDPGGPAALSPPGREHCLPRDLSDIISDIRRRRCPIDDE